MIVGYCMPRISMIDVDGFGIPDGVRHYAMMKASCNNSTVSLMVNVL